MLEKRIVEADEGIGEFYKGRLFRVGAQLHHLFFFTGNVARILFEQPLHDARPVHFRQPDEVAAQVFFFQ